ncbi:MAG TPA: hypothetical protein VGH38_05625 [Bryobacteraceae bacterium]|jgi:hypothetical protein
MLTLCAVVAVFSALALAESYTGRLVDANCMIQQQKSASCDPTGATTSFAIIVSGKAYRFDEAGNTKAANALKNRADRSADPNHMPTPQVAARVMGTADTNGNLKVDTIEVQ